MTGAYCFDCSEWMLPGEKRTAVGVQTKLTAPEKQPIVLGQRYICPKCKHIIVCDFNLTMG